MGKYPIYALMALAFIGLVKLLQITVFDVEKYDKNKKLSFAKPEYTEEVPYKKESEEDKNLLANPTSLVETESLNADDEESFQTEQEESSGNDTPIEESSSFEQTQLENNGSVSASFSDLKNVYLAPKIASLPPGQLREDVVIRYYRHEQDGDKVYTLKGLGYYIHEKEANETAGLGSNVIYYGNDVNQEDIQLVAYSLLESGLPIKAILPTQFSWKSNSLEIGTDTLLVENSTLSQTDIQRFTK